MPEGHTIHRAARDLRRALAGQSLDVSSPQGRFSGGASVLDGRECRSVEAYGKHLIIGFDGEIWLHVHLGLFGRIKRRKLPLLEPKGAVRVRLVSSTHVVDINGPTICENLERAALDQVLSRIGPDVLRDDADANRALDRIGRSRAPIGRLLMDQSVIAGIGNIYRTELLWRAGLHPHVPGNLISRDKLSALWEDAKQLLALGVKRNVIITSDVAMSTKSKYRERTNIFGKSMCPTCGGVIQKIDIAGRRAFVCNACQKK